jgi:ribosomal protein S18 acetylase RimI-like enzyme
MINIRVMTMDDYDAVIALMSNTPGISLRDADSREATARYLQRNPGLSFVAECVAESQTGLCGCVMSGHDGRRGYLQHLLVLPEYRQQGIGKCHLDVFKTNDSAARYWQHQGWTLRVDIDRYSFTRPGNENA